MNIRVASPAESDLELRIIDIGPVMHHSPDIGTYPANTGVPLDYTFTMPAKVSLRVIPGVVVAQAQPGLLGRLAAITIRVRE